MELAQKSAPISPLPDSAIQKKEQSTSEPASLKVETPVSEEKQQLSETTETTQKKKATDQETKAQETKAQETKAQETKAQETKAQETKAKPSSTQIPQQGGNNASPLPGRQSPEAKKKLKPSSPEEAKRTANQAQGAPAAVLPQKTTQSKPATVLPQKPSAGSPVPGMPPHPPTTQGMPPSAPPFPGGPAASAKHTISKGQVSLNFDDADVYEVVHTLFGNVLKVNYIIDPRVKGRVTFRSVAPIAQENVLPLMEVILRLNGVAVVEDSGLYRIIPISEIAREPAAIGIGRSEKNVKLQGTALLQVIPIRYTLSSEIVKLISPFLSTNAALVDVPRSNQIVVVDTDANVKRLIQLVNIFDSEQQKHHGPQVFVHHVQNSKAKDIVTMLQQIFLGASAGLEKTAAKTSFTPSGRTSQTTPDTHGSVQSKQGSTSNEALLSDIARIYANESINAVIIVGTPEDYETIKETIRKMDIVPRQVMIEGVVAQISLKDNMSMGLAWSMNAGGLGSQIALNPGSLNSDSLPGSGFSYVAMDAAGTIKAVISALASESKAKLLASPHILVSDNREARIQVGQSVPIPTSETIASASVPAQRTIQYKDIGIILKVKPMINDSGLVTLDIVQEVSTYSTLLLYSDEKQIILNKTEVSTNLVVQDGQTIVIGGLIREDASKSKSGIPLLIKIPILGYLFGNTDIDESRNELIILLTPHVVKSRKETDELTKGFVNKMTEKEKDMKRDEILQNVKRHKQNEKGQGKDETKVKE
ncbi:MAG: secretin N-terminal domain-containing protein [Syntrophales bacterium]